ncbi:PhoH-like protein [uncultured Caudovirales phage]|uniref:PhoH-like protein n=1 Tax=uncultured Caudovirales phage TaxID=2100421 RepID=A0A6J5KNR6_9CAUD|nr:PhoH-like protein [uncultured Caudovirales phage]
MILFMITTQNTTANSMLSALTRIGEGSKMVVTGDVKQSDRGKENGLQDFLNRNPNIPGVAVCPFGKQHVERHPVISAILKLYGED